MRSRATQVLLVVVPLILLGVCADSPAMPLVEELPRTDLLVAGRFRVAIAGLDMSSADVVSAEVDPIEIEMHDVTQSNDPTWKQFTNGAVRYGEARFTFRVSDSNFNKDLSEWIKDTVTNGERARKTINIMLLDDRSTVARTYNLVECFPLSFSGDDFTTVGGSLDLVNRNCPRCPQSDNLAELIVQIGSMIIDDGAQTDPQERDPGSRGGRTTDADHVVRYKGFDVEIENVDNTPPRSDSSWATVRGGAVITDSVETMVDNDGQRKFTPGKQYVSDITMTGYLTSTSTRRALIQWMNNSIAGKGDLRADVTITPKLLDGTPGPAHQYEDSMITRIEIPRLTAGSKEPVEEKVTLRPMRRNDRK
ncbi:MAG: phage tail protein [Candidatus Methylomirabilis oxyfera]|nr:phage tail protein [Candidatus Methylomirabilis oxyfera]